MEPHTINTNGGPLELIPATRDELASVAARWPMGMILSQRDTEPNGLVFQVGEQEAYGIKLQPPDTDEETAKALYFNNQALIASALPSYLEHKHQSILLTCVYYKQKSDGQFESGFAFFASPHPADHSQAKANPLYDGQLGEGAFSMIVDMAAAIAKAGQRVHLPVNAVIGMDVRPRLALGSLGLLFLTQGAKVFAVQYPLHDEYPVWAFAVRAGF